MQYRASAPGSLMLLGEYGVLYGMPALVCALDKRITVTLTPRTDLRINIQSSQSQYATTLSQLSIEKPFEFVLAALKQQQSRLRYGCDIEIVSDFSAEMGFGSSAAVTVATLAALFAWLEIIVSPLELLQCGCEVVRMVQGVGSGADIAAAVYGGMVHYQTAPLAVEKFAVTHPLTALYAGFKTKTAVAIKQVQQHFARYPDLLHSITNSIGQCAHEGIQAVRDTDWARLGQVMNVQQGLLASLGVSLPLLYNMVQDLRQQPSVLGAKISGSGLGDCVIGLGAVAVSDDSQYIPLTMTLQGVCCEKI